MMNIRSDDSMFFFFFENKKEGHTVWGPPIAIEIMTQNTRSRATGEWQSRGRGRLDSN